MSRLTNKLLLIALALCVSTAHAQSTRKISELPTGQKVGNILDETLRVGGGATTATTPTLTVPREDSSTNTAPPMLRLQRTSSGTPATGIGASLDFQVETSAANNEIGASIEAVTTDVTATSEDFHIVFKTMAGGAAAAERARISSTGQVIAGGDGSGSLPAFRGTDADTGFYFNGAGRLFATANNSGGFYVDSLGTRFDLPFAGRRVVAARTSTATIANYQSNEFVTNRGASGTVTLTLNAPTSGETYTFLRVANQTLRIEPSTGAAFFRASGTVETADKYLELASTGALITVLWDGTNWLVLSERGTINVEP